MKVLAIDKKGYIEGQGPREIAVVFVFVTHQKTEFFVIAFFSEVINLLVWKGEGGINILICVRF